LSQEVLPRGDPEVLAGPSVCVFHLNARDTEAWVLKVRERSGQRVDWGYSCGYAIVSYLGDRAAVLRAIHELRHELVGAEHFRIYSDSGSPEPHEAATAHPEPIGDATLSELERLLAEATAGPWHREYLSLTPGHMVLGIGSKERPVCIVNGLLESPVGLRDVAAICTLRNNAASLLAELRSLRSAVSAARDDLARAEELRQGHLEQVGDDDGFVTGEQGCKLCRHIWSVADGAPESHAPDCLARPFGTGGESVREDPLLRATDGRKDPR
jgi:hypothetical protein